MGFATLAIIAGLIAVNALYVAAEFAAVSVRRSRIQTQADEGSRLARRLLPVLDDPHRLDTYIAACQIGITLSSLIVGAFAQARLAPALVPLFERFGSMQQAAAQSTSAVAILISLTATQMVLGELVPKSLALRKPTQIALLTVIPMQWSLKLLAWFIVVLNGSGGALLRLMGVPTTGHRHIHSADELEFLVAESGKAGLIRPDEQARLRQALQLGDRSARELMVPRTSIEALEAGMSVRDAIVEIDGSAFTRFPVHDGSIDHIIGIVHVRDLATASAQEGPAGSLRPLMRPVMIVPETLRTDRLLMQMKSERRTMAILADEFGGTAGLVTIDDILDELIGDVGDEFREDEPQPLRLPDGRVRLPGSLHVGDAWAWTRVRWPRRATTVGGLVTTILGRLPAPGERLSIEGIPVEVEAVHRRAVQSILVTPRVPGPIEAEARHD